jgi:hypothetical protein
LGFGTAVAAAVAARTALVAISTRPTTPTTTTATTTPTTPTRAALGIIAVVAALRPIVVPDRVAALRGVVGRTVIAHRFTIGSNVGARWGIRWCRTGFVGGGFAVASAALGTVTIPAATVATAASTTLLAPIAIAGLASPGAFARLAAIVGRVVARLVAARGILGPTSLVGTRFTGGRRGAAQDGNIEHVPCDGDQFRAQHLESLGHQRGDFLVRRAELLEQRSRLDAAQRRGLGHGHCRRQCGSVAAAALAPAPAVTATTATTIAAITTITALGACAAFLAIAFVVALITVAGGA